jgi:type II secretory pathway component PulF
MGLFAYQAFSKEGKKVQGTIDASTPDAVREHLTKQGLYPILITPTTQETATGFARIKNVFARSVTTKDKILFTKQLAVLLKAGVPLLQALELLVEQFSGRLRTIIIDIKDGIKEGKSLAVGLSKYPKVFDNIYVQLVRAGEASGKLELILERLTEYMEKRAAILKKVKGAMTYPIIQLSIVVLVVIALLTFVLPNLAQNFASQGAELPVTTQFLMNVSYFIRYYYWIIALVLVIVVGSFIYWKNTKSGTRVLDRIKLKIPIVSFFSRMGAIVQFCRTLGMLIESGVNLSEALDIVVKIINNRVLADALEQARENIIKQGKIAQYLQKTGIFPPIAIYLINTGEQSGQLGFMLLTVAQTYEDEMAEYTAGLSSLLEPVMLIVMAVVVGFVVLSIMQPILNQVSLFKL